MKNHPTLIAARNRTRIFILLVVLYGVLMLFNIYLSLHQSYPRMNTEGLARLLFSGAVLSWLSPRLNPKKNTPLPNSRWYAVQIDCLLISLALLCYAIYFRLTLH
jgi:hypothetical protein